MNQPTAIIVAGMHRSGTSALAGALNRMGIPLGDRLLEPGPDNPKGYWEHRDIVAIHERLLTALGSHWDDIRALPDGWASSEPARDAATALSKVIDRDFAEKPVWAVKDPRICRLLPLWTQVLDRAGIRLVVLLMVRRPSEVSASLEARNGWKPPIGDILWLRYMGEALDASRHMPRAIVTFEALLTDALATLSHALSDVGMGSFSAGEPARAETRLFVDSGSRHHVGTAMDALSTRFGAIAAQTYAALSAIARRTGDWSRPEREFSKFNAEWRRQAAVLEAFAAMTARLREDRDAARLDCLRLESELAAQIGWSRESQSRQEALQAERAELSSRLAAQIRWSEESQARQETLQAEKADLASKLDAQIRWSEESQARQETLQADKADLVSKLDAQIRWSEESQARQEALQARCAELTGKLQSLDKELWTTKGELAQAHGNVQSVMERLREARRDMEQEKQQLVAALERGQRERARLAAELEVAHVQARRVEDELRALYASRSWRATKLLRMMSARLRRRGGMNKDSA